MVNIKSNKRKKSVTIRLEGECGIQESMLLYGALAECLEGHESFEITNDADAQIDLTTLQTLFAFEKAILDAGKNITKDLELHEDTKALLEAAGLTNYLHK